MLSTPRAQATEPRHGRHHAERAGGIPVATWIPRPPATSTRHRAGLLQRIARTVR